MCQVSNSGVLLDIPEGAFQVCEVVEFDLLAYDVDAGEAWKVWLVSNHHHQVPRGSWVRYDVSLPLGMLTVIVSSLLYACL